MSFLIPYAAAVCAAVAAWLVRGALAVQSAVPGAPKIGILPPWWELLLFVVAGACVVVLLRPSRDQVMPLFVTVLCIVPWLPGVRTPALLVWTGPLAASVWLGAVAAAIVVGRRRRGLRLHPRLAVSVSPRHGPAVAALAAFVFFSIVAFGAREMVPGGDEPHYLILTQSLLYDRDLKIENNHARQDYAPYFGGALEPHYFVRGTDGEIYSVHAPGLPALIAPAFLVAGYPGVVVFLLLGAALGVALVWAIGFQLTGRAGAASYAAASVTVATPVAFHAFSVFPDGPGGALALTGIWALGRLARAPAGQPVGSRRTWLLHGLALAMLPWIHSRFALLAGLMGFFVLVRLSRTREGFSRAVAFLAVPVVSAVGWFAYFWIIYGTPNPQAPYGTFMRVAGSWSFVTGGLAGVVFDQQFGILLYAPVFLMAAAGWVALLRRRGDRRLALELLILVVPYMLAVTHFRMWWGGWSAPGRFTVPILWMGGLLLAAAWGAARTRAARGSLLAALGLSTVATLSLASVQGGRLAYNVRDGYSLWLEWLSPLGDLPLGLPSFFRWQGVEWVFHLQNVVALALFAGAFLLVRTIDRRWRPASGALALALMTSYAAAGIVLLSLLWRVHDSSGVRPAASQVALLRAAGDERRVALGYDRGVRPMSVDAAVRLMRLESPARLLAGDEPPALVIPGWFPAGRYELLIPPAGPGPAPYEVRALRLEPPVAHADAAAGPHVLSLPVEVPSVIVRGRNLLAGTLRPLHVATRRERFADARVRTVRRYGAAVAWFLTDDNAFGEPEGFWVRGASTAEVVLQPDDPSAGVFRVRLRNGAAANAVTLEAATGEWREQWSLAPGEERDLSVPLDPRRGAVLLRITTSSGFRPSEVEPGSTDTRLLGAWLEIRDGPG
jgi:hypothetical protein